jgi:hypothetical protein
MPAITLKIGLRALTLTICLLLFSGIVGRILPAGESLIITLPVRFGLGLHLLDVQYHLLYPLRLETVTQYKFSIAANQDDWITYAGQDQAYTDIYIANLFTGESRQLTDDPAYDAAPVISADSQWVAFMAEQPSQNIYGIPSGGGRARMLTANSTPKSNPIWSPDGTRVLYQASDDLTRTSLYISDATCLTTGLACTPKFSRVTSANREDYSPTWSPDGRWIAFLSDRGGADDVYIMDASCLDTQTCVQQNPRQLTQNAHALALAFSRDGRTLWLLTHQGYALILYALDPTCIQPETCKLLPIFEARPS